MWCKCATPADQFHGWECSVSGGECAFLFPDSQLCAAYYGEGPDSGTIPQGKESILKILRENPEKRNNMLT